MEPDQDDTPRRGEQDLVETVQSLQREVDGLLEAGKLRSVIEQAKGVLAERLGITPEQAFDRLRTISQTNNTRLVDVAATIIGESGSSDDSVGFDESHFPRQARSSGETSASWTATRQDRRTRAGASGAVARSLAAQVSAGDAAARLLVQTIGGGIQGCLLMAIRHDDSLELVGAWGYPDEVTSAWRRIPLAIDVPLTVSVREGAPLFFENRAALHASYPALARVQPTFGTLAILPVHADGDVIGTVALGWTEERALDSPVRETLVRQVSEVGPALLGDLRPRDQDASALEAVLRVSGDPWLVLVEESSPDPVSLVIEQVSDHVASRDRLVGRRLFGALPRLAEDEEFVRQLKELLREDGLLVVDRADLTDVGAPWDGSTGSLRAARTHGRLVLMWAMHP